jgi:hypothetical protein
VRHGRFPKPAILGLMMLGAAGAGAAPPAGALTNVESARLGSEPVTVRLAPALRRGPDSPGREAAVSISIEGIAGRASQPVRINVFLDKPGADRKAGPGDPHFVGFIQLMPRRDGTIAPRSQRLALRGGASCAAVRRMTVTLVPVVGADRAPVDSALTVGRVYARCERG